MIISISAKCSDMFNMNGRNVNYDGYVPEGLGIGGGDYISFTLNTETGQIVNWKAIDDEALVGIFSEDEDDDEFYEEDFDFDEN